MVNVSNIDFTDRSASQPLTGKGRFYAVYDSCASNNDPGKDLAFIEQRQLTDNLYPQEPNDEKCFRSLSDAKAYVKKHFQSGAEYFSLNQSADPDNIFYVIVDKITYLVA